MLELDLDFVLYEWGIVMIWVRKVNVGDELLIGGLCGFMLVKYEFDEYLLVVDDVVLFVLVCCLEELFVGVKVIILVEV